MEKYLVITIDVEPDCSPDWRYSNPLAFKGVSEGIKNRLHPLFVKYRMVPTYLINNVVLENEESINIFLNLEGKYELGTHLHPEFIEPQKIFNDYAGKKGEANQCDLLPDIEFEKMKNITDLFEKQFGKKPVSFRAGRFSAGRNTIKCLERLGYKADTSVTPYIRWKDKTRTNPIDYSAVPEQGYCTASDTFPYKKDKGKIIEIPVTIIPERFFFWKKYRWLRPYYSNYNSFIKITESVSAKYKHRNMVFYNMMFHNVEVLPGLSPYAQTEEECVRYLDSIEKYFIYCRNMQIKSIALAELADLYGRKK